MIRHCQTLHAYKTHPMTCERVFARFFSYLSSRLPFRSSALHRVCPHSLNISRMMIPIDLEQIAMAVSVFRVHTHNSHENSDSNSGSCSNSIGSMCNFLEKINLENRFISTFSPRFLLTPTRSCARASQWIFIDFILFFSFLIEDREIHWYVIIINRMNI